MNICFRCHQPITQKSTIGQVRDKGYCHIGTEVQGYYGAGGLGCPTPDQTIANLEVAMKQGFVPEFCRTHYLDH